MKILILKSSEIKAFERKKKYEFKKENAFHKALRKKQQTKQA